MVVKEVKALIKTVRQNNKIKVRERYYFFRSAVLFTPNYCKLFLYT